MTHGRTDGRATRAISDGILRRRSLAGNFSGLPGAHDVARACHPGRVEDAVDAIDEASTRRGVCAEEDDMTVVAVKTLDA